MSLGTPPTDCQYLQPDTKSGWITSTTMPNVFVDGTYEVNFCESQTGVVVGADPPAAARSVVDGCLAGRGGWRPVTFVSSRWALLAASALALGSCQASAGSALPAGPPIITVTMSEFSYHYDRPIPPGRVIFRLVNAGHLVHEPNLFPLSDEVPPIDQQVKGDTRQVVAPFAGTLARNPGQVGTFAVDLEAGQRYAFVCFARTPDNQAHAKLGMAIEFRPGQKKAGK